MADYWKSNDRKYCDFCKCWIADNKPSISFHEGGKRHKAAVAQRLHDISKKSIKDEKAKDKVNMQLRQMEDAALKAYAADISRGGDITTQSFNAVLRSGVTAGPSSKPVDPLMPPVDFFEDDRKDHKKPKASSSSMWVEAKSDDGHSYYWNVKTNESLWEKPKEGYMTIKEYENLNNLAGKINDQQTEKHLTYMNKNAEEIGASLVREQFKARHKKHRKEEEKIKEEVIEPENFSSMDDQAQPLGQWQVVAPKKEVQVDLQLPTSSHPYTYVPPVDIKIEHREPVKRFKEKTVTSLSSAENDFIPGSFKKRTIGNAKRNVRQRTDDD